MKRRVHAGYAAVCAACVLFHAACGRWSGAPWYLDRAQLQTDYLAAVADAAVSDASEVYRDLPCIVSPDSGDGLEWTERGGRQFVLVCSMTDGEYAGVWTAGRQFVTDGYTLWVVLPYELEERMRRMPLMGDSLECRMRMLQLLGLPPDSPYDRLLFFYADRSTLLRPCPNPDVGACAAPDVSPGDLPAPYRKWFEARTALSYGEENPYPWTRLGYTYDWHRDAAQRRGLGEFIVPGGTEVIAVEQVTVWRWYRGLAGIVRTDDTDGAGVRSGS